MIESFVKKHICCKCAESAAMTILPQYDGVYLYWLWKHHKGDWGHVYMTHQDDFLMAQERLLHPIIMMQEYSDALCEFIDDTFDLINNAGWVECYIDDVLTDDYNGSYDHYIK